MESESVRIATDSALFPTDFVEKSPEDIGLYYSMQVNQTRPGSAVDSVSRSQSDATTSRTVSRPFGVGFSVRDVAPVMRLGTRTDLEPPR
jgi:hypothetical protein